MNRLKKLANEENFAQQLEIIDKNELQKIVMNKLKEVFNPEHIQDYAKSKNLSPEDLDFEDYITDKGVIKDIWDSIQDDYVIYPNITNYHPLTDDVELFIFNILYNLNAESKFEEIINDVPEDDENGEDTWNQNDFI